MGVPNKLNLVCLCRESWGWRLIGEHLGVCVLIRNGQCIPNNAHTHIHSYRSARLLVEKVWVTQPGCVIKLGKACLGFHSLQMRRAFECISTSRHIPLKYSTINTRYPPPHSPTSKSPSPLPHSFHVLSHLPCELCLVPGNQSLHFVCF